LSGGIYTDGGPIYVTTGKIDDGFGGPQTADSRGDIGLIYDRRTSLDLAHEFSVVAGHVSE
jgi:hypothetical protein